MIFLILMIMDLGARLKLPRASLWTVSVQEMLLKKQYVVTHLANLTYFTRFVKLINPEIFKNVVIAGQ